MLSGGLHLLRFRSPPPSFKVPQFSDTCSQSADTEPRIWNGSTKAQDTESYHRYLLETGVKEYKKTEGNRGVVVIRRIKDERAEFTLISFWDSYNAIKKFAGENIGEAVFYPDDEKFLVEKDVKVSHYDTLVCEVR